MSQPQSKKRQNCEDKKQKDQQKQQLLKQKLLANTQITHNIQQYEIQELNNKEELLKNQLKSNLSELCLEVQQITHQYSIFIKQFTNNLQQSPDKSIKTYSDNQFLGVAPELMGLNQLKEYLNVEKKVLTQIVDHYSKNQQTTQSTGSTKQRLHSMSKRKKLEICLQQIHRKQLEREVRYLQEDILGLNTQHTKSHKQKIIYIPDQHMTHKEEEEYNGKIKMLLEQLERLNQLEPICSQEEIHGKDQEKETEKYLNILDRQIQRLSRAEAFINEDAKSLSKVNKSIQDFDSFLAEMPGLPFRYRSNMNKQYHQPLAQPVNFEIQVDKRQEISNILKVFGQSTNEIVGNRTCVEQDLIEMLKTMKNKAKRLGL